jgi:4,5-DOPA dioxygenase extradiol
MYPGADIPVVQLSLAHSRDGKLHFEIGQHLLPLRSEGVLILGSGNVVHNLRRMQFEGKPLDWALAFDSEVKKDIVQNDFQPLVNYQTLGEAATLSINSAEHYLPLLYILGLRQSEDDLKFYCESVAYGSLSMRCVRFG